MRGLQTAWTKYVTPPEAHAKWAFFGPAETAAKQAAMVTTADGR